MEMTPAAPHSRSASQVSLLSDVEAAAPGAPARDARTSDDLETRFIALPRSRTDSDPTDRRRWYAVALLTLTSAFLYADQNLLSPNLSAVAEEFGLDDREKDLYLGGYLQLAFFIVGAPASLLIGWLADKTNRVRLLAIVVAIGEGPCLGTYWVETYWQLFAARALTGVAVGGCLPLLFSICGDLFQTNERAYVATFLTVATGAGIALGQIMAGTVGPAFGWRLPFVLAAAPAIALALLVYATVDEPERGAMEKAVQENKRRAREREREKEEKEGTGRLDEPGTSRGRSTESSSAPIPPDARDEARREARAPRVPPNASPTNDAMLHDGYVAKIDLAKLKRQLRVPSNALILAQGLPGTIPWGMLNAYFVDYLHAQKGLRVEEGTLAVSLFGLGAVVGTVSGGVYGQRVYNREGGGGRKAVATLMGVTTALGSAPGFFFLNVDEYGPGNVFLYAACLVGGVLCAVTPPNVRAVLLNVNPPETRGTMFAVYSQVDDVGKGGGPAVVAGLIVAYGRVAAFNVAVSGWLVCGAILLALRWHIDKDVEKAQEAVAEEVRREEARREQEAPSSRERGAEREAAE